jgi:hypothetical protein
MQRGCTKRILLHEYCFKRLLFTAGRMQLAWLLEETEQMEHAIEKQRAPNLESKHIALSNINHTNPSLTGCVALPYHDREGHPYEGDQEDDNAQDETNGAPGESLLPENVQEIRRGRVTCRAELQVLLVQ